VDFGTMPARNFAFNKVVELSFENLPIIYGLEKQED
jgi:hypothetical protein